MKLITLSCALPCGLLWRLARTLEGRRAAFAPSLVLAWLVIPFMLALLESAVGQSIFQPRYLLFQVLAPELHRGRAAVLIEKDCRRDGLDTVLAHQGVFPAGLASKKDLGPRNTVLLNEAKKLLTRVVEADADHFEAVGVVAIVDVADIG